MSISLIIPITFTLDNSRVQSLIIPISYEPGANRANILQTNLTLLRSQLTEIEARIYQTHLTILRSQLETVDAQIYQVNLVILRQTPPPEITKARIYQANLVILRDQLATVEARIYQTNLTVIRGQLTAVEARIYQSNLTVLRQQLTAVAARIYQTNLTVIRQPTVLGTGKVASIYGRILTSNTLPLQQSTYGNFISLNTLPLQQSTYGNFISLNTTPGPLSTYGQIRFSKETIQFWSADGTQQLANDWLTLLSGSNPTLFRIKNVGDYTGNFYLNLNTNSEVLKTLYLSNSLVTNLAVGQLSNTISISAGASFLTGYNDVDLEVRGWYIADAPLPGNSITFNKNNILVYTQQGNDDNIRINSIDLLTDENFQVEYSFSLSIAEKKTRYSGGIGIVKEDGTNLFGVRCHYYDDTSPNAQIVTDNNSWYNFYGSGYVSDKGPYTPTKLRISRTGYSTWQSAYWNGTTWVDLYSATRDMGPGPFRIQLLHYHHTTYRTITNTINYADINYGDFTFAGLQKGKVYYYKTLYTVAMTPAGVQPGIEG